jgi:hypothetical protein
MCRLKRLPNDQLLSRLFELVYRGRKLEADLIEHLAEVDARRLYLGEGCPSMFAYCVEVLRFAEAVAYKRIAAMRAARRCPELLAALREGEIHLTAVSLLAPQLTEENAPEILAAARHRTAGEIRRMLADRQPKPDVASSVRRISTSAARGASIPRSISPTRNASSARNSSFVQIADPIDQSTTKAGIQVAPLEKEVGLPGTLPAQPIVPSDPGAPSSRPPEPLGEDRYLIRFTADGELHAQIQELKSLMRHQIPDGDVGKILAKAIAVLLKQVRARKFGECSTPRATRSQPFVQTASAKRIEPSERVEQSERATKASPSRQIPPAIRRGVSKRDRERCTFVSAAGRRCGSRDFLEFHHCEPWARQPSHAIEGISLRCRAHNQYEAERDFGAKHMECFRRRDQPRPTGPIPNTTALIPDPNRSTALQPELDLNPVGDR